MEEAHAVSLSARSPLIRPEKSCRTSSSGMPRVKYPPLEILDGEVACLVEHSGHGKLVEVGNVQIGFRHSPEVFRINGENIASLEHVHEERRLARLGPIQFELFFPVRHREVDGDGVVDVLALVKPEAVAIVKAAQFGAIGLRRHAQHFAVGLHVLGEVAVDLVLRVAEHRGVVVLEGDVHERGKGRAAPGTWPSAWRSSATCRTRGRARCARAPTPRARRLFVPTGPSGPPPRTARRARHSGPFASHGRGQRVGEMANSRQKQATEILAANREIND